MKGGLLFFTLSFILVSCASQTPQAPKEKLISRMNGLTARPSWVIEERPLSLQKDKIIALGTSALTDEHKMEVSFKIAERNGKHLFQESLEQESKKIFNSLTQLSSKESKYLNEFQKDFLRSQYDGLKLGQKYWEKVEVTKAEEERGVNHNKVFVSIETSKASFLKKLEQVVAKSQNKKHISKNTAKEIKEMWVKFINNL